MVREAEEYAEEDKAVKDRIDARNSLESYLYNMKNLLDDEEKGVSDKISEADKEVSQSVSQFASSRLHCCSVKGRMGRDEARKELPTGRRSRCLLLGSSVHLSVSGVFRVRSSLLCTRWFPRSRD